MSTTPIPSSTPRPAQWLAPHVGRTVSGLSRLARRGEGSVIGGKVALSLDQSLPSRLAAPMKVALVSGTNGKTTTTTLLAMGLAASGPTATNKQGANLASGLTGALLASPEARYAALEVDEAVLPWALHELRPRAVALLNLSRDQLDRLHEVRATAERWSRALAGDAPPLVVANADDPLVAWAVDEVAEGTEVVWVGAGLAWQLDSSACPWCESDLAFADTGWHCPGCRRSRPDPTYRLADDGVIDGAGQLHDLGLTLPGRSARANAAMALAVIDQLGLSTERATARWAEVRSIEGRYQHVTHRGVELVLHLAKNPAGWADLLDLVVGSPGPLVLVLNAQGQDGRDPSWIWDVPFERLAGRRAYCLGERGLDLAVRLEYAGLDVARVTDLDAAVDRVTADRASQRAEPPAPSRRPPAPVDLIANYSAFQQVRRQLAEADPRRR
jgi:lipid II isoglutaminyl synthase (glutamine-hydrolysing)